MSVPFTPATPTDKIVGTDTLGRPFTDAERTAAAKLLRAHDFRAASKAALYLGIRKTRNIPAAEDLVQRACVRLVRGGWDPAEVSLKKRMMRLVWSEWTHSVEEWKNARKAEEAYLRGQEEHAAGEEARRTRRAVAMAGLDELRARLTKANDEVNILWLDFKLQGIDEPKEMARLSGRKVEEFYRATDRRKRHVEASIAVQHGVKYLEEI